jgi:hypothetical protein
MVNRSFSLIFFPLFFQSQILFGVENLGSNNFIVISNSTNNKVYNDYRMPAEDFENTFVNISKLLKSKNPNLSPLLLFYTEDCRDDQITPRMFILDKNKLFIYSEAKKLRLLGNFIDPSDKIMVSFKNSVSKGKLIAAYWSKKDLPTSIIVDDNGFVYSVSKEASSAFSIKTLGISSPVQPRMN